MKNTKKKTGYSTGEWKVVEDGNMVHVAVDVNNGSLCTIFKQRDEDGMFNEEQEANALLISAAPDMYKALLSIIEAYPNGRYAAARMAIAKAEGNNTKK